MINFKNRLLLIGLLFLTSMPSVPAKQNNPWGKGTIWAEAQRGNLANVKKLIRLNPKLVNARRTVNKGTTNEVDWTPLSLAAVDGRIEVIKYLLSKGANVNLRRSNGNTPLYDVIIWGRYTPNRVETLRLLVSKGASANERTDHGFIPLDYVTDAALAQVLLENGANINDHANVHGMNPIQMFVKYSLPEMSKSKEEFKVGLDLIRFMINKHADLNFKDNAGNRVLDYAQRVSDPIHRQQLLKIFAIHGAKGKNSGL